MGGRGWRGARSALTRGPQPQYGRQGQPRLNKSKFKQFKTFSNFGRSEKYLPMVRKIEIKYYFEYLEEMNNSPHRNFLGF
jgi:hypothetical protein